MGLKEEKHIVIEFQKKILQEAGCSAEVIAFLDEIEDEVFCEYYCFCFLDGMPIEEVRRIDSVPVQNWKDKIKRIKQENWYHYRMMRMGISLKLQTRLGVLQNIITMVEN